MQLTRSSVASYLLVSLLTVTTMAVSLANNITSNGTTKPLVILSLLPYPDTEEGQQPSWDEGHTLFLAEQLAIDLLNARPDILPGYHLKMLRADSGCDIRFKAALTVVNDTLMSKDPILGMVGPGCSASASTIGQLTGRSSISLLNIHLAGSLKLADRTLYPNSFGALDSTEVFAKTLLELVKLGGWKQISALYDDARLYYSSTAKVLEEMVESSSKDYNFFISAVYETHIPLRTLQNKYRVVMLFVGPNFLSKILCLALHYGMVHPVYQFIVVSRVAQEIKPEEFMYENRMIRCSETDMQKIINNLLIIHYQLKPLDLYRETSSGLSYTEFYNMYNTEIEKYNNMLDENEDPINTSFWAPVFFDAVWSLGLALNNSMDEVNFSSYRYGENKTITKFKNHLQELSFEGVSGRINFSSSTGYTTRNVDIYRVLSNRRMDIIGYYNNLNITVLDNTDIITGDFDYNVIVLSVPKPLGACVLVITVFGLLLVLILQAMTIYLKNDKSVKASSPKLSQFAFVGCYIMALGSIITIVTASYTDLIAPNINCYLWNVLNVASSLGPTLVFGTMCTRTWRLYRIFVHYKNPGKFISERCLIGVVLVFVTTNLIISVGWTTTDPFVEFIIVHDIVLEEIKDSSGRTVDLQTVETVINSCKQKENYFIVWLLFLVLLNTVLMLAALVLAFLTRRIKYKDFQTRGIMTLTYIMSGLLGLGIPIYFILLQNNSYSAILTRFIVSTFLFNSYVFLACFLVFLPPVFPFLKLKLSFKLFHRNRVKVKPVHI